MNRCEMCMKNPLHPDKKCCFNCSRASGECDVWHNCGEDCPGWDNAVKTNADRIRAMNDEDLCKFLGECKFCDICVEGCDKCTYNGDCDKRLLEWLKQPAE